MRVDIYTLFPTAQASVAAAEIAATSATTHLSPEESQRTEKTPRRGPRKRDEPTIVVKRFACIAPVDGQWVLRWEQTTSLSGEPEQYEVETGSESLNLPDSRIQEARELALARLHDMGWLVTHVATQVEADAARERFVELLEDSVLKHAAARD